jgi:hypothetical protein
VLEELTKVFIELSEKKIKPKEDRFYSTRAENHLVHERVRFIESKVQQLNNRLLPYVASVHFDTQPDLRAPYRFREIEVGFRKRKSEGEAEEILKKIFGEQSDEMPVYESEVTREVKRGLQLVRNIANPDYEWLLRLMGVHGTLIGTEIRGFQRMVIRHALPGLNEEELYQHGRRFAQSDNLARALLFFEEYLKRGYTNHHQDLRRLQGEDRPYGLAHINFGRLLERYHVPRQA